MSELVVFKHDPTKVKHKRPIRKGDRVRIIEPKFVDRVGYPLIYGMLMDEVKTDPKVKEALQLLGLRQNLVFEEAEAEMPQYLQVAIAKLRVEQRGFGGRQRTIHYLDGYDFYKGAESEVYSRRVVKTGTYCRPRSGVVHTYDGPEYWDEPGGLADCKTHVLLTVSGGEIEACNVELLND
jgi:hypothetical protein